MEYHPGRLGIKGWYEASVIAILSSTEGKKAMFRKEVKRLLKLGVLEEANESECRASMFA